MKMSKVVLAVLLLASLVLVGTRYYQLKTADLDNINFLLTNYTKTIENNIQSAINILYPLEGAVLYDTDEYTENEFNMLAEKMFLDNVHLFVSYIPDGVVKYTYNNEGIKSPNIGLNTFEDPRAVEDAMLSKKSGKITISKPVLLKTGEYGIVARKPLYRNNDLNSFIGFVSVVISSDKLLEQIGIADLYNAGYMYQLKTSSNVDNVILSQSDGFNKQLARERYFQIGATMWSLSLYKTDTIINNAELLLSMLALNLLVSFFIYSAVSRIEKRNEFIRQELYFDPLTRAYNRKKLDEYLDDKPSDIKFTLFYIDLNDFKPVNDTYGHDIGDKLLKAFVDRTKGHFKSGTPVIRMGGDEFVIIVAGALTDTAIEGVACRIEKLSNTPFFIDSNEINISASIGYASYPTDANNLNELVSIADNMMYSDKKELKCD